jgi:hypothetical protein
MLKPEDAFRAGKLLQWALRPRENPNQEKEYRQLLDEYLEQFEFRLLVKNIADGLGLKVLDADQRGMVLGPEHESAFAFRPSEFRPGAASAEDRLLDGLVQLAIAASVFPTSRDLEADAGIIRPPVTVDEVEDNLRRLCQRIEAEHRTLPDPEASQEVAGLYEAWRIYQSRPTAIETSDKRQSPRGTRRIIQLGFDKLCEFGCFRKDSHGSRTVYQATWRYQVQVKEMAALRVYERVRRLLLVKET